MDTKCDPSLKGKLDLQQQQQRPHIATSRSIGQPANAAAALRVSGCLCITRGRMDKYGRKRQQILSAQTKWIRFRLMTVGLATPLFD
ncbi:hypothetical protein CEXT_406941 [Caerostris extrusa]|uniref:Uncharacterized protein n=1 Tax=Caerostris extrusa TaxID=172846 RepID=A0AAV4XYH3_CAEEX|nr:hypothetical protein CEXT_406941 [Caerostris extrusa]